MARRIIWSKRAQNDRILLYRYWNKRNRSTLYSKKLHELFITAAEFLSAFPLTGRKTSREGVRVKFVSNFAIFYEFTDREVIILTIFDTRQDPGMMEDFIHQ